MAKDSSRRGGWRRWLSHRFLVGIEVVLLVGAANQAFGDWVVSQQQVPWWGRTLFAMAGVIGAFSALFAMVNALAAVGVNATHKAVQSAPVPLPGLAVHLAALTGIFFLYAWLWGLLKSI